MIELNFSETLNPLNLAAIHFIVIVRVSYIPSRCQAIRGTPPTQRVRSLALALRSCKSPDSESGYNGPAPWPWGNVYSDLQTDKRMSLISTSTAGSGSATSDALYSSSLYNDEDGSPQQSPLAVGAVVGDSNGPQWLYRTSYENVVEGSTSNR